MIEIKCKDINYTLVREQGIKKNGEKYDSFFHFVDIKSLVDNKYHRKNKKGEDIVLTPFDKVPIGKNNKPYILTVRKNREGKELFPVLFTDRTPEEIKKWRAEKRLISKQKRQRKSVSVVRKTLQVVKKEKQELDKQNKSFLSKRNILISKINKFESKIKKQNKIKNK